MSAGHGAARADARWSLDFVYDQFGSGQRLRVLTIAVEVTREFLAAISNTPRVQLESNPAQKIFPIELRLRPNGMFNRHL